MAGRLEKRGYDGVGGDTPPMCPDVGADFGSDVQGFVHNTVGGRFLYAAVVNDPVAHSGSDDNPSPEELRRPHLDDGRRPQLNDGRRPQLNDG